MAFSSNTFVWQKIIFNLAGLNLTIRMQLTFNQQISIEPLSANEFHVSHLHTYDCLQPTLAF